MIDVALGNLKLPALQRKRGIQAGGDEDIQPQIMHQIFYLMKKRPKQNKQVPKPRPYEESLADVLEGKKQIYFDPQYIFTTRATRFASRI